MTVSHLDDKCTSGELKSQEKKEKLGMLDSGYYFTTASSRIRW